MRQTKAESEKDNTTTVKKREARVRKKRSQLKKLCDGLNEGDKCIAMQLAEEVAFMAVVLEDLKAEINASGGVEKYQNGSNQWGYKMSAALRAYNTVVKSYTAACDKLARILPETPAGSKLSELMRDD